MTEKSLKDVLTALNSGELKFEDFVAQIETDKVYLRRGTSYSKMKDEGVTQIAGVGFVKVYSVETERIDRDGNVVERQSRNGKETAS
jgi:hypothetical protein